MYKVISMIQHIQQVILYEWRHTNFISFDTPLFTISLTPFPINVTSYKMFPFFWAFLCKCLVQILVILSKDIWTGMGSFINDVTQIWFFPDLLPNPFIKHLSPKNYAVVSKLICVISFRKVFFTVIIGFRLYLCYPTPVISIWGKIEYLTFILCF